MAIPKIADYAMPVASSFPANKTVWQVEPKRAVLLIHDMQRYFLRFYADDSPLITALVDNLVRLREWANENDVPVVYTAQPHEQPEGDRALLNDMWGPGLPAADPKLQAVVDALTPTDSDIVLTKWRYSAFKRSDLQDRMKDWGRDQLVIGGIYAHIGCMVTAVDAFMSDIQPFLVGDALADFSEAEHLMALKYVATRCGSVISASDLAAAAKAETSKDWLEERLLALIEDETEIDPDENLILYGLDSLQVMMLAAELKERGVAVSFEEMVKSPTLNGWWSLIENRRMAA